jgi:hypothetical protein
LLAALAERREVTLASRLARRAFGPGDRPRPRRLRLPSRRRRQSVRGRRGFKERFLAVERLDDDLVDRRLQFPFRQLVRRRRGGAHHRCL